MGDISKLMCESTRQAVVPLRFLLKNVFLFQNMAVEIRPGEQQLLSVSNTLSKQGCVISKHGMDDTISFR